MITRHTGLLIRDEFLGFAKSKVMLVLWVVLPIAAVLVVFLQQSQATNSPEFPVSYITSLMVSSLAGTIAAVMVAVDIIGERSRKVYELFFVRPVRPEAILWAKLLAVSISVSIACAIAMILALVVDGLRGESTGFLLGETVAAFGSAVGVVAISAAVGIFFGVVSRSVLVAVILILYLGQNLVLIPLIPTLLQLDPTLHWIGWVGTALATIGLTVGSGVIFRRAEL